MTLQELLEIKVEKEGEEGVMITPDFKLEARNFGEDEIHITIRADGYQSEVIDMFVSGNKVRPNEESLED